MLMLACLIGGCSQLDPFIDRRRNAGEKDMTKLYVGRSTPENPAVCYNILTTSYAEVKKTGGRGVREAQNRHSCRSGASDPVYLPPVSADPYLL